MLLFKKMKLLILMCSVIAVTMPVNAHILNETSAQVILRDGQVEVRVITDIDHFIEILQNNQAWLMGDVDEVMPKNLTDSQQETFIKEALTQKMKLIINKKALSFERTILVKDVDAHNDQIVFQAKHQFADVNDISISFHQGLGAVHINVVKPQYKLLGAGESGNFSF
jgi:homoserine dehydrogenase